jgi:hypothetical protein
METALTPQYFKMVREYNIMTLRIEDLYVFMPTGEIMEIIKTLLLRINRTYNEKRNYNNIEKYCEPEPLSILRKLTETYNGHSVGLANVRTYRTHFYTK